MFDAGPAIYMQKAGSSWRGCRRVDLEAPIAATLALIGKEGDRKVRDPTLAVLDRTRHEALVKEIRAGVPESDSSTGT